MSEVAAVATAAEACDRGDLTPEGRLHLELTRAVLARAEARNEDARRSSETALEIAERLEAVEVAWRILDSLGPTAQARRLILTQASRFTRNELRSAYLAHRERARVLQSADRDGD